MSTEIGPGTPPPIHRNDSESEAINAEKEKAEADAAEKKGFILGGKNLGQRVAGESEPKQKSIFDRAGKVNNANNNASVRPQADGDSEVEG